MTVLWRAARLRLHEQRTRWLHRAERTWAGAVAAQLVGACVAGRGRAWHTEAVAFTATSVAVVMVASPGSPRRFVVKIPWTAEGVRRLRRQARVLTDLHRDPRLHRLRPLIPRCAGQGEFDGRYYCVEEALPGVPAGGIALRSARHATLLESAVCLISDLHARTSEVTRLDDATVGAWVDLPLRRLDAYAATRPRGDRLRQGIRRLQDEIVGTLSGRSVRTSLIHGDFWPGNLLVGSGADVTGVVDWDHAAARQLPLHDLLHLHVLAHRLAHGAELGDVVLRALHHGLSDALDVPAQRVGTWLDGIPQRPAVLLYWLRHIRLFIDSEGHHDNPRWLRGNVERVLVSV
ncbi:phosphotransferase family protein [Catellatospora bangladeshensis]|uniref:Aminoglycoside phosphotransferase domain-containing protein n=1 Tax=Catellatospora bangladeshensis TaxID=310355 RepID=A0A8J3JNJ2_9ACTN|nr:phosphotransferase [Catellatospora bangladeshensis]GIF83947.1 hypothetical protein Cba03nite_52960 [Catellatospora bangladeshensis]